MAMLNDILQKLGGSQGLEGLTQKLAKGGLGQQVQSWIGHGDNRPVSGQQILALAGVSLRSRIDGAGPSARAGPRHPAPAAGVTPGTHDREDRGGPPPAR
jgi:hypothetical protein